MRIVYAFVTAILALGLAFAPSRLAAAPILLKSGTVNVGARTLQSASASPSDTAESPSDTPAVTKYIVQHDGKIPASWRQALVAAGAKVLRYIPENAYLVSVTEESLSVLRAQVPYTALLPYSATLRLDPAVAASMSAPALASASANAVAASGAVAVADTNAATYTVSLFAEAVREEYAAKIAALAGCRVVRAEGDVIRADLTASGVREVAGYDEVEYVTAWVAPKLNNNMAVQSARMNVETVWPDGASDLGLTGRGQVVAVADTGLDTGNTATLHEDVRGRVSRAYALARSNDWSDLDGHGTHVVGSVLGDGTKSSSKIRGTAYEATLVMQSVANASGSLTGLPSDLKTLFSQAYEKDGGKAGARIHSNSWGTSLTGYYSADTKNIDTFTFNHPDLLVLFSASNDGTDRSPKDGVIDENSLSSEATTKNGITVGASENQRTSGGYAAQTWGGTWSSSYPKDPIKSDYISRPYDGSNQGIAAYSSRGPCRDGRIKPDIVAPGTDVLSMRSSLGDTLWGTYNSYYQYCGGTSMSTPLVAGAAALVRQWLVESRGISDPDAATVKALLLAGAKSLTPGQYGTGEYREIPEAYPNNVEGWGQVNLGRTLVNERGLTVYDGKVIADGEVHSYALSAAEGSAFSIVMAYADAPASLAASRQLVDDLDLLVVSPSGKVLYPNSLASADRLNNVEGVRVTSAEAGVYIVTVTGYDVNTPMSTSLTGGKADAIRYSLVANGATEGEPAKTTVSFSANGGKGGPSGTVTATSGQPMPKITAAPTRDDFVFTGYYDAAGATGVMYYRADLSSARYWDKSAETATLYAHWKVPSSVITVNGVATECETGASVTLTPPSSVVGVHGYTNLVCTGWRGTGSVPASGSGSSVTFTVTGAGTLDWIFETNYFFRVTKQGSGNVSFSAEGLTAKGTGYWAPVGKRVTLKATAAEHSHFVSWKNAETSGTLSSSTSYTAVLDRPRLVLATFAVDTYTVKFDLGSYGTLKRGYLTQSVRYGQAATAPTVTAADGCVLTGWKPSDFSNITADLTVRAVYGFTSYPIVYRDVRGCDNSANPTSYAVTNAAIVFAPLTDAPPGCRFVGWSPKRIPKGSTGEKEVVAQWMYTLVIDGGAPASTNSGTVITAVAPLAEIRGETNVVCTGWLGTGSVPATGTADRVVFTLDGPGTLTWLYATNYWVAAEATDGEGGSVVLSDGISAVANPGWHPAGTTLVAEAVADEGWRFVGWEADGTALQPLPEPERTAFAVQEPVRLRARFEQIRHTVTFDLGAYGTRSGGGALEQDVVYGAAAVAPSVDAAPGWTLAGWSPAFDRVTGDLAVRAKYEAVRYPIAYEGTMGVDLAADPTDYTVLDAVTFAAPTNPPGWRFLGWEPSAIAVGETGAKTVTATWEHIRYAVDVAGVVADRYYGDVVAVSRPRETFADGTNVVCLGWTGTGDVADGVGTQVTFTVTQPSTFAWRCTTNFWVSVEAAGTGGGSVVLSDGVSAVANPGWYPAGTNLVAEAAADEGWQFAGWEPDGAEVPPYVATATRDIAVDGAVRLVARFARRTYVNAVDGVASVVTHGDEVVLTAPFANVTNGIENVVCVGWRGTGDVPASGTGTEVAFAVTQPSTLDWLYVTNNLGFAFSETETSAARGGRLKVTVRGGSRDTACGVQVLLLEHSAKKSDLDLKGATVDGVAPEGGLAFPLSLAWERGRVTDRVIEIPVKAAKADSPSAFLAFELAAATDLHLGADRLCTAKVEGEDTATVYVRPVVLDAAAGRVSGGRSVAPGKDGAYAAVMLKATANAGYWFAGWYGADGSFAGDGRTIRVAPSGDEPLPTYEARFVGAQTALCGTYRGTVRVNLRGMTLVKGADTSADVFGDYPLTATLSTEGKVSGSVAVGGRKVSFKGESCRLSDAGVTFDVAAEEKAWFGVSNVEPLRLTFAQEGVMRFAALSGEGAYAPLAGDGERGLGWPDPTASAKPSVFEGIYSGAVTNGDGRIVPLSVSVDAKGKVKVTGLFWDGTSLASSAWLADGSFGLGSESAVAEIVFAPKALGKGSYRLSLAFVDDAGACSCLLGGRATTYTAASVAGESVGGSGIATPYAPLCWVPEDAGADCALEVSFGGESLKIPCTVRNGAVTGLGKPAEKGVTVKFGAKTGILSVTKAKEWSVQGVLGAASSGSTAAGVRTAAGVYTPARLGF